MSPKIGLYDYHENPDTAKPKLHIKRSQAQQMVDKGFAKRINKIAVQLLPIEIPANVRSNQGKVYESAGADFHPKFYSGGLTRTETKPAPFSKCRAARVGHQ